MHLTKQHMLAAFIKEKIMTEIINNQSNTVMYPNEDKYFNEWANDRDSNSLYPTWLQYNYPEVAAAKAAERAPLLLITTLMQSEKVFHLPLPHMTII